VNTHFARTGGRLVSMDTTPPFQPNVSKPTVALKSSFGVDLAPAFKAQYHSRKQSFYAANTKDTHQAKKASFDLVNNPVKKSVYVTWVEKPAPCYADPCVLFLMSLTPVTAPLWLMLMDGYMGKQKATFKKTCVAFKEARSTPKSTPRNLREQLRAASSRALAMPKYWDEVKDPLVAQYFPLKKGSAEYQRVYDAIDLTTRQQQLHIHSIERIQNIGLWQSYCVKKSQICQREAASRPPNPTNHSGSQVRNWLFNGCPPDVVDKIMQQGFSPVRNQPVRRAGLEVLFTILAASLPHPNV
jgi:hypothetical protein